MTTNTHETPKLQDASPDRPIRDAVARNLATFLLHRSEARYAANAAIAAYLEALDAAGFAVVPKQPPDAMVQAGEVEMFEHHHQPEDWTLQATRNCWRAMLAAAPEPPK